MVRNSYATGVTLAAQQQRNSYATPRQRCATPPGGIGIPRCCAWPCFPFEERLTQERGAGHAPAYLAHAIAAPLSHDVQSGHGTGVAPRSEPALFLVQSGDA